MNTFKDIWPKYDFENTFGFSWHASCALANNRILIHGGYDGDLALEDTHIFNLGNQCLMFEWFLRKHEPKKI